MSRATEIGHFLRRLTKMFNITMNRDLKELGLTKPQMIVIGTVYMERKTIGQIAESTELSYSTVSGIIDRLERDGWLERTRDDSDRRIIWISKTDKFEQLKEKLQFFQESFYEKMLADLSEQELDTVIHSLELLTTYLEKKVEEKP
ncbi:MarR family winged helix-turn-helix transcriptional regulator [Paenibacillus piri]|uniref:MarR family transcriptional regulator n=1 Tax=Paenibacillus piri TaxID=2547395 RepID=A0A4R5KQD9_9BACL|nr:MarR family transcriptional regulator [Paenibacillus piri]TDF97552.1 MarR family transcriptional regulator [Paenibacillus piri]